jgi:hypothetical protein
MPRGRRLLIAQRKAGGPLRPPPAWLPAGELQAWRDIVGAAPDVLRAPDFLYMRTLVFALAAWRSTGGDLSTVRLLYRMLGHGFVPMRARRRLIFPERPIRR